MEGRFNNKDRIIRIGDFFQENIKNLINSEDIDGKDKRSYEKAV